LGSWARLDCALCTVHCALCNVQCAMHCECTYVNCRVAVSFLWSLLVE
jgi:hypothetical protein